jgi:hypothetical protein
MSAAATPAQPARPPISFKILGLGALVMVALLGFNIYVATRHHAAPATTIPVPTPITPDQLRAIERTTPQGTPAADPSGSNIPNPPAGKQTSKAGQRTTERIRSDRDELTQEEQMRRAQRLRALQSDALMVTDQAPPPAAAPIEKQVAPPVNPAQALPTLPSAPAPVQKAKKRPLRSALKFMERRLEFLGLGAADRYTTVPY